MSRLVTCSSCFGSAVAIALTTAASMTTTAADSAHATSATKTPADTRTLERRIEDLESINDIQILMSKHEYYHAAEMNKEELKAIWAMNEPDVTFAQNQGYYIGPKKLWSVYGEGNDIMRQFNLTKLREKYPQLKDDPSNWGAGDLIMHTLTTPIIVIAGDGKTAKGMWYTPGQVSGVTAGSNWIWEKYGCDFIKENGQWKIWHMHVYTDFFAPVGTSWVKTAEAPKSNEAGGQDIPAKLKEMLVPSVAEVTYKTYGATQVPVLIPMPEPYRTFSETFSYGYAGGEQKH